MEESYISIYQQILLNNGYFLITDQFDNKTDNTFFIEDSNNNELAVRIIHLTATEYVDQGEMLLNLIFQAEALMNLNHMNVIKYLKYFHFNSMFFLIMERREMSLKTYLIKKFSNYPINEGEFFSIALQLIQGISYLLENKVSLKNLSLDNIFACKGFSWKCDVFQNDQNANSEEYQLICNGDELKHSPDVSNSIEQLKMWFLIISGQNENNSKYQCAFVSEIKISSSQSKDVKSFLQEILAPKEGEKSQSIKRIQDILQDFFLNKVGAKYLTLQQRLNKLITWEAFKFHALHLIKFSPQYPFEQINSLQFTWQQLKITSLEFEEYSFILPYFQGLNKLELVLQIESQYVLRLMNTISNLKRLTSLSLNLDSSDLRYEGSEELSKGIKQLQQLRSLTLILSSNNIFVEGTSTICKGLKHLKSLKQLDLNLSQNNIQDEGMTCVSLVLSQLSQIEQLQLNVESNEISNNGILALSSGITNMKQLKYLQLKLNRNYALSQSIRQLMINLSQLQHLITFNLDLKYNYTLFLPMQSILSYLHLFESMKSFSIISGNNVHNDDYQLQHIEKCQELNELSIDMSYNKVSSKYVYDLCNRLSFLPSLTSFSFNCQYNKISTHDILPISQILLNLKELRTLQLNLEYNNILDVGVKDICLGILQLKHLESLNLNVGRNKISDNGGILISETIQQLYQLKDLTLLLEGNNISQVGTDSIYKAIFSLDNLTLLSLSLQNCCSNLQKTNNNLVLISKSQIQKLDINLHNNSQVSNNNFMHFLMSSLSQQSPSLTSLILNFGVNKISDTAIEQISNTLFSLTYLSELELNFQSCNLSSSSLTSILLALSQLKQLNNLKLNLKSTDFQIDDIIMTFHFLSNLAHVESLHLSLDINTHGVQYLLQYLHSNTQLLHIQLDLDWIHFTDFQYHQIMYATKRCMNNSLSFYYLLQ